MEENDGRDEAVANENGDNENDVKTGDLGFLERAKDFVVQHKGAFIGGGLALVVAGAAVVAGAKPKSISDGSGSDDDYEPDDDYETVDGDEEPEYSGEWEDNEEDDGETLSEDDAALIYGSRGMDEDYTFGYDEDELKDRLYG